MPSKNFIALDSSLKWYQKGVSSLKLVSSQFICSKRPSTKKKEKNCWALKIQAQRSEHDKETDKVKCSLLLLRLWLPLLTSLNIMEHGFRAISVRSGLFIVSICFNNVNSWRFFLDVQVINWKLICRVSLFLWSQARSGIKHCLPSYHFRIFFSSLGLKSW